MMASRSALVRLSSLRKLREPEQVAAVCYRLRNEKIEFLLVQTRGSGRWTFPKGRTEAGLTHAQAAALEASEEAGVHGRIEEAAFAQYFCRKRDESRKSREKSSRSKILVSAHLCEVTRLRTPKESNRNRTWFAARDARIKLLEDRSESEGAELARVLDRALPRLRRRMKPLKKVGLITSRQRAQVNDPLRKVNLEAAREPLQRATVNHYLGHRVQIGNQATAPAFPRTRVALKGTVLQFAPIENENTKLLPARKQVKSLRRRDA
jgi:8-oxo-dGTP pyrophosphatase MutT (NUDIX family)